MVVEITVFLYLKNWFPNSKFFIIIITCFTVHLTIMRFQEQFAELPTLKKWHEKINYSP